MCNTTLTLVQLKYYILLFISIFYKCRIGNFDYFEMNVKTILYICTRIVIIYIFVKI